MLTCLHAARASDRSAKRATARLTGVTARAEHDLFSIALRFEVRVSRGVVGGLYALVMHED